MSLATFPRGETLYLLTYHHRHGSDSAATLAPIEGGPLGCAPEGKDPEAWVVGMVFGSDFEDGEELEIAPAGLHRMPRLPSLHVQAHPIWVMEGEYRDLGLSSLEDNQIRWAYDHEREHLVGQVHNGTWEPMTSGELAALRDSLDQNGWLTPPEGAEARDRKGWPTWAGLAL